MVFNNITLPIAVKGHTPRQKYSTTLVDYFNKRKRQLCTLQRLEKELLLYSQKYTKINTGILKLLFLDSNKIEPRPFKRLPRVMGEAPVEKLIFNLHYQDTKLKIAIEEKLGNAARPEQYQQEAHELLDIVALFLNTKSVQSLVLWKQLTDNDLDALIHFILCAYNNNLENELLQIGFRTNEIAIESVMKVGNNISLCSIEELIHYQVFAGTIWWLSESKNDLDILFEKTGKMGINDIALFKKAILESNNPKLVFLFDDNGELVLDLLLIQKLLEDNNCLTIVGVINTLPIANNANIKTLETCLKNPIFKSLYNNQRFHIFKEKNHRPAIDLSFCSLALLDLMQNSDLAFIKGVSFFETIQYMPIDTYYAFVVYSHDAQICTGLAKGDGVFVKMPPKHFAYIYLEKTLKEQYEKII